MRQFPALPFALMLLAALPISAEDAAGDEEITWGKATDGLAANLRPLRTVVKPGEPIEFEVRIRNVSEEAVRLWGHRRPSPTVWSFDFGDWAWSPRALSLPSVPLQPGDTVTVRCLVATTRDSLTAEQRERPVDGGSRAGTVLVGPFRSTRDDAKRTLRLPEGTYRVRASTRGFHRAGARTGLLETNTIELWVGDVTEPTPRESAGGATESKPDGEVVSTAEVKKLLESSPTVWQIEELARSLKFAFSYAQGSPYAWTSWRTAERDVLVVHRWGTVTMSAVLTNKDGEQLAVTLFKPLSAARAEYDDVLRERNDGRSP